MSAALRQLVQRLDLRDRVHFLGPIEPEHLREAYSAADVFVLATSYEGWANVFLEAMACALPVVTTQVGGNDEVVNTKELGILVPLGDQRALTAALGRALEQDWDREHIRAYAQRNSWDERVATLTAEFTAVVPPLTANREGTGALVG